MNWRKLRVAPGATHHLDAQGNPAYGERFDSVLKFHVPGLAPVHRSGRAWHIRSDGSAAYDRRFLRTFGFYEGLATIVSTDGWHHITADGNDAYARRHDWCGNFQEERCVVRDWEGRYFHITPGGEDAYLDRWRYVGDYRDGIAVVQAADGHSTHIGRDGLPLHGNWFIDLDVFHKGFARARDEDGWMHVGLQGRSAYGRRFQAVEPFYNGQARVERFDGALEIIDETGALLVELRPARHSEFARLSEDMVGFWRTQTIAAAVQLRVFEVLPATEKEVADRCGLHADGARRLLRALGELSLTARQGGQWTATTRGEMLQADHTLTLADAAMEYAGPFTSMWTHLSDALRQDTGWVAPDVFGAVARDTARRVGHHRMLQSYARHDYAKVCRALDLRGNERVIDAGGGLGVLAHMIADAHPSAEITVLEHPEVVAMAQPASRIHWQSGSLFDPWEIAADAVVLSRVLHDWDDDEALQILRQARASLPRGGRIYIVEMLVSDECVAGSLCDLHLLMVTGGRERSAAHYRRLLATASFELTAVQRLPALPSIILGVAS